MNLTNNIIINNYRTRHRRPTCGYCNCTGHTIRYCNSPNIRRFNADVFYAYAFYKIAYNSMNDIFFEYMNKYIAYESLLKIKALYYFTKNKLSTLCPEIVEFQRTHVDINDKSSLILGIIHYFVAVNNSRYSVTNLTYILYNLDNTIKYTLIGRVTEIGETYRNHPEFESRSAILNNTIANIQPIPMKFDIHFLYISIERITRMLIFDRDTIDCPICLNTHAISNIILLNCRHPICYDCILQYFQSIVDDSNITCCTCRALITTMYSCDLEKYNYIRNKHILYPTIVEVTPVINIQPLCNIICKTVKLVFGLYNLYIFCYIIGWLGWNGISKFIKIIGLW